MKETVKNRGGAVSVIKVVPQELGPVVMMKLSMSSTFATIESICIISMQRCGITVIVKMKPEIPAVMFNVLVPTVIS